MTAESADIHRALIGLTTEEVVEDPLLNNKVECETAEEAITTDSEEYLSEPLRCRRYCYSDSTTASKETLRANNMEENDGFYSCNDMGHGSIQIPIVGYEIMEERARFTKGVVLKLSYLMSRDHIWGHFLRRKYENLLFRVYTDRRVGGSIADCAAALGKVGTAEYSQVRSVWPVFKLRIENKNIGNCWYVFRRYTDFVRLCNRLKHSYPQITQHLPRKRWLGNNFDPLFLDDRLNGLQTLINAILTEPNLVNSREIQEFFCLNEPPMYSETNEESKAIFESLEDTIYHLKHQVLEKERAIDNIYDALREKTIENENLKKLIKKPAICEKCQASLDQPT